MLCLAPSAHAARVLSVHVRHHNGQFVVRMHVLIEAPGAAAFRALQEYRALSRYNPNLRIEHLKRLTHPDRVELYSKLHACVLFFCRTIHQVQIATARATAHGGVLTVKSIRPDADFKSAGGRWTVRPCAKRAAVTCLEIRVTFVPRFWIPPLIGPWIIRDRALAATRRASVGLQRLALAQEDGTRACHACSAGRPAASPAARPATPPSRARRTGGQALGRQPDTLFH